MKEYLSDLEVYEHLNEKTDDALFWTLGHYFEQRKLKDTEYSTMQNNDSPTEHAKLAVVKLILTT